MICAGMSFAGGVMRPTTEATASARLATRRTNPRASSTCSNCPALPVSRAKSIRGPDVKPGGHTHAHRSRCLHVAHFQLRCNSMLRLAACEGCPPHRVCSNTVKYGNVPFPLLLSWVVVAIYVFVFPLSMGLSRVWEKTLPEAPRFTTNPPPSLSPAALGILASRPPPPHRR